MKILVFKTSEKWSYCAGGLAIIAEDFTDAQRIMAAEHPNDTIHASEESAVNNGSWVLVASYTLADPTPEKKVVLYDFNWA